MLLSAFGLEANVLITVMHGPQFNSWWESMELIQLHEVKMYSCVKTTNTSGLGLVLSCLGYNAFTMCPPVIQATWQAQAPQGYIWSWHLVNIVNMELRFCPSKHHLANVMSFFLLNFHFHSSLPIHDHS